MPRQSSCTARDPVMDKAGSEQVAPPATRARAWTNLRLVAEQTGSTKATAKHTMEYQANVLPPKATPSSN